jgi:hypothetical protein
MLIILAHTNEELFERIKLIVRRCFKHNMFLKLQKVKFMRPCLEFKFFGCECEKNKFWIEERLRTDLQAILTPISRKGMQSFLGTVVICSGFIPDYSFRAIPLYNMTTASYDWSTAWSKNNYWHWKTSSKQ